MKKIIDLYQTKAVIFIYSKKWISDAIIVAQNIYWNSLGKESKFSHIAIVCPDGYVYESTASLKFKYLFIPILKHGIKRTEMIKYYKKYLKDADRVGIQYDFEDLDEIDWSYIQRKARSLYKEKKEYGFTELFGTLWALIKWKFYTKIGRDEKAEEILKENNPFDKKDALYCIAFVEELL